MILFLFPFAFAKRIDGQVKEMGTGLPGYSVEIACGSLKTKTTPTGLFQINCPDDQKWVLFTSPHYRPKKVRLDIFQNKQTIWLKPILPAVEIIVEEQKVISNATERRLDKEKVERTPGTHDDPIRLLQALPGFASTREYAPAAGDIIIRGAAPKESRVLIDGVDLPYLYHFQQYASVIHTRMLDAVHVYPSAFNATYGDSIGGIVKVDTQKNTSTEPHAAANLNFIMGGFFATTPLSNGKLTVSGRRSYADLFSDGSDLYTQWPIFWDYLSRYDVQLDPNQSLFITALGSKDAYGRFAVDPDTLDPVEQSQNKGFEYDRTFHSFSVNHRLIGNKSHIDSVIALVGDWKFGNIGTQNQQITDRYIWVRNESVFQTSPIFQMSIGMDAKLGMLTLFSSAVENNAILYDEAELLSTGVTTDQQTPEIKTGVWLEPKFRIDKLSVSTGVRIQAAPLYGDLSVDPRLTAIWKGKNIDFRMGGGRYSQSPTELQRNAEIGNSNLTMAKAWHGSFGTNFRIGKTVTLDLDAWARQYENTVRYVPNSGYIHTDGIAYGAELNTSFRLKERLFSWLTLSVMESQEGGQRSAYHQPFALNYVVSWKPNKQLHFGLRYRYASGMPYTPVVDSIYNASRDSHSPIFDSHPSATMPEYQKVDLHSSYTFLFKNWNCTAYAELWYVPADSNVLYPIYNYDYSDNVLVQGPGIIPLMGIRVER